MGDAAGAEGDDGVAGAGLAGEGLDSVGDGGGIVDLDGTGAGVGLADAGGE